MSDRKTNLAMLPTLLALSFSVAAPTASGDDAERAFVRTADDTALQWGPCPEFLPQGCGLAVLHGDPANVNADVLFKVPAGASLPIHWHTSAERMVLVAGELHVTYAGQETVVLRPGTYAYGPAKLAHGGACVSAVPCILFIAFESPVDAVAGAPE
jgi:quercetin dioxygenase-like cupin family protein